VLKKKIKHSGDKMKSQNNEKSRKISKNTINLQIFSIYQKIHKFGSDFCAEYSKDAQNKTNFLKKDHIRGLYLE